MPIQVLVQREPRPKRRRLVLSLDVAVSHALGGLTLKEVAPLVNLVRIIDPGPLCLQAHQ
jgi:hypothetical protein